MAAGDMTTDMKLACVLLLRILFQYKSLHSRLEYIDSCLQTAGDAVCQILWDHFTVWLSGYEA